MRDHLQLSDRPTRTASRILTALTVAMMLSACSDASKSLELALTPNSEETDKDGKPLSELDKAARAYSKSPKDAEKALAYADLLKQHKRKPEALTVLQQASESNAGDRKILSAYGRLALDQGKTSLAKGLLEAADDPSNPDWRVLSARGTVLAKQDKHRESISYFERARPLSSDHPSVINNLALAYMMSGEPAKAEPLLRQASTADPANVKVRQNLAIVLSLQGKYGEAKKLASQDLSPEVATSNAELLRTIVRLEEKPSSNPTTGWSVDVAGGTKPIAATSKTKPAASAAIAAPAATTSKVETSSIRPTL